MSRDYSPDELRQQHLFGFKDASLFTIIKLNEGPRLPRAKNLLIPRDRRVRTVGATPEFHPLQKPEQLSPKRNFGSVPSDGVSSGLAINAANPNASRLVRVGRPEYVQVGEDGEKVRIWDPVLGREIEKPEQVIRSIPASESDWNHHGQWPERPGYDDRSLAWIHADGSITAGWQWQPRPGSWPITLDPFHQQLMNHLATWGRFNNRGELLEGSGGSTANGDPWPCTTLTPDLVRSGEPVLLSMFIGLYPSHKRDGTRVDGLLEDPEDHYGAFCGDVQLWKENDELIRKLQSANQTTDYIASCFITAGALINDQAGSKIPIKRDAQNKIPRAQLDPKAPALRVQACADWNDADLRGIRDFQFNLEGAHLAVEQHVEFRVPGDPHTPFVSEPVPDPRVAQIESAHGQFDDVIHELGLDNGNTKYLSGMNDQTMSEAIRLISKGGQ